MINKYNIPIGTDIDSIKSSYASVPKSIGYPTLNGTRCCNEKNFGSYLDELKLDNMHVTNFGLPQYSDLNKCYIINNDNIKKINNLMEKNNLNTEDLFHQKYKKVFPKTKRLNLENNKKKEVN